MSAGDPNDIALHEQLADELTDFADDMLAEHGCFAAFGGGVTVDGDIEHLANDPNLDDPEAELQQLVRELRRDKWHVGMILVDTRVVPPDTNEISDAVWVISETRNGDAVHSFLPYSVIDGEVHYGRPFEAPDVKPLIYRP